MWHENGQEVCRGSYRDGVRMPSNAWDLDGKPTLVNGSGWVSRYTKDGKESETTPYEAGIFKDNFNVGISNGIKKSEISYHDGKGHQGRERVA